MKIEKLIDGIEIHKTMATILNGIHSDGPISNEDFETLAYIKKFHPGIFKEYESKLISLIGLFYKAKNSSSLLEEVYSIFADSIESKTGKKFTPVQADAYSRIKEKTYFSFSAPTSTGKSFLFRELIQENEGDIIIVVPSRALISEYMNTVLKLVDKTVLVLQFIDVINTENTSRRIFIITPERGVELFKNLDKLNITLILFDEAQISEDGVRGMKFDSFVRRTSRLIPDAKKVFTHPFVENPEAQLIKHDLSVDSEARLYKQNSVGKIFLSQKDQKFSYFSPFERRSSKILSNEDIIKEKIEEKCTVLIYVSKSDIYKGKFIKDFLKYIELCPELTNPEAIEYIEKLKEFIGASSSNQDRYSQMIDLMRRGIVIHHGSMPLKARLLIEEFVNKNFARICFSTSTLAQGINMPFDVVWINNFRFSGTENQKILDLKNLIGRAGRSNSKVSTFDYGYVIVEQKNINLFSKRLASKSTLSNKSKIDEEMGEMEEDQIDIVEAIKNDAFNDSLQLTDSQVERIKEADIDGDIEFILDTLLIDGNPITASDYYHLPDVKRKKLKDAFKNIFLAHLRRKELTRGEFSILSASIPILLWQIQGKSFSEIISLRYAFLSEKDQRLAIGRAVKNGDITSTEADEEIEKIKVRYSPIADSLPNINLKKGRPLYSSATSVTEIQYDTLVYDTYDYIDKVISFSLKDPLSGAFILYFEKTRDKRAVAVSNYIRYGTNDSTEIWLIRYGFSFDDIEWIKDYLVHVDENKIVFKNSIGDLDVERYKVIERFVS